MATRSSLPALRYKGTELSSRLPCGRMEVLFGFVRGSRYASPELQADEEIVRLAVTQDGSALYYADKSLQRHKEIALHAVTHDPLALLYVESKLRHTPELQRTASRALERTRAAHLTPQHLDQLGLGTQLYRLRQHSWDPVG